MIRAAYLTGRILTGLAAALAVTALLAAFVPVRATLLDTREGGEATCGSILFPSDDAGDQGCEDANLQRFVLAFGLPVLALVVGGIGIAMVWDTYQKV